MSNTLDSSTDLSTEETYILPILPYGLSSGNAYTDTCMLFLMTIALLYIVYIFKTPIDETCNTTILMLALIVFFLYNIGKYPMLRYSYNLKKVPA